MKHGVYRGVVIPSTAQVVKALIPWQPAVGRDRRELQEEAAVKSEVLLGTDRNLGAGDNRIKNSYQNHAEFER